MSEDIALGYKVQDKISGFTGIVNIIGEHISGCTRVAARELGEEDASVRPEQEFFFPEQLEILETETEFTDIPDIEFGESDLDVGAVYKDQVTGFTGVAVVVNYHLFNCPQALVVEDDEEREDGWFDEPRLSWRDDDFVDQFTEVQESDVATDSGPVADAPSENLSR